MTFSCAMTHFKVRCVWSLFLLPLDRFQRWKSGVKKDTDILLTGDLQPGAQDMTYSWLMFLKLNGQSSQFSSQSKKIL